MLIIIIERTKVTKDIISNIFEFFNPEYLKTVISSLLNNLIKNSWVEIKKINGNISKTIDGVFSKDKYTGKKIFTSKSLKNSISVKRLTKKTKLKIISNTYKKALRKILVKNFI